MTRIDFYILQQADPLPFLCRLVEKAYRLGHHCHIQCSDQPLAAALDAALWQFKPASFIPHQLQDAAESPHSPITIGSNAALAHHDLLINLDSERNPHFHHYQRLAEIIPQQANLIAAGRDRFRYYRDHQYPLESHQIS
ncbi:MAG: DNA polymerase III subunit chi [Gammaproteobacteria bacterium]|nr:DNA polymerase III subunit chi [Gammaproteobacteria bacterium]